MIFFFLFVLQLCGGWPCRCDGRWYYGAGDALIGPEYALWTSWVCRCLVNGVELPGGTWRAGMDHPGLYCDTSRGEKQADEDTALSAHWLFRLITSLSDYIPGLSDALEPTWADSRTIFCVIPACCRLTTKLPCDHLSSSPLPPPPPLLHIYIDSA